VRAFSALTQAIWRSPEMSSSQVYLSGCSATGGWGPDCGAAAGSRAKPMNVEAMANRAGIFAGLVKDILLS